MENRQPRKRGTTATRRRGARQKAMQALYQWDFDTNAHDPAHIVQQFCELQNMQKVDIEYFEALFLYATEHTADIDAEISSHMDRPLEQLDPIERSVLRICCTELKTRLDAPYKVVVNEALEISKDFGADKGYRYINGIADKLAASLRAIEYTRDHPDGNPLSEQQTSSAVGQDARAKTDNVKISFKEKAEKNESSSSRKPGNSDRPGSGHSGERGGSQKPVAKDNKKSVWDRDKGSGHKSAATDKSESRATKATAAEPPVEQAQVRQNPGKKAPATKTMDGEDKPGKSSDDKKSD